jgi:hypothetical protein
MKKALYIVFITIFFGMCAAPLAGTLLGYKNINAEKRTLASAPEVFTKNGFNAEFTREFDDYYTDNFAFRTNLVTLYAEMNSELLGESISDQVIIGKDGWLFFEPSLNDYMKTGTLSGNEIRRLADTLEMERDYTEGRGAAFIFTVAPNKASVCGQYMPDRYKVLGKKSNVENLSRQLDGIGFEYVDLYGILRGGDMQLYHKLDTHWNNAGALAGYNALLGKVKESKPGFSFDKHENIVPRLEKTWQGDLSGMLYPAAGLLDEQYVYGIEKKYTTDRPMRSLEDLTIKTQSENETLDLVMFRDSFANALIPLMSNEFSSITYSRAVPYDYSLLDEDTDVVILEIVERNIPEMLGSAPLMPAPETEITADLTPADMDIKLETQDSEDYIKIAGIALPPGYGADKDYDIFIRLSGGGEAYTFKPFPILEKNMFEGYDDNGNAAFSMLAAKNDLPPGEYTIEAIAADGKEFYIDSAGALVIQRR